MYSYITVLSNWMLGFDKYNKIYSKKNIEESSFPDKFYLLKQDEIHIGIEKANNLINKINNKHNLIYSENRVIKINTLPNVEIYKNIKNGKGWFINENFIPVESLEILNGTKWEKISIENLTALSYKVSFDLKKFDELIPRTLSFLPIASACQAKCKFCFSESSISVEQEKRISDFTDLEKWCQKAKKSGAERFVITGGGDPGVLKYEEILNILSISSIYFKKNVMITNGIFLSRLKEHEIITRMKELKSYGLSVLSISYHHFDSEINKNIMGIDTKIEKILNAIKSENKNDIPEIRLVCVLQKGGIENKETLLNYLKFAAKYNIKQVCLKELYVASTYESLYSKSQENDYCVKNQVFLSDIQKIVLTLKNEKIKELPWGSPVYKINIDGKEILVSNYTEPSTGWERKNGIARSWNYMADKKCYASLEDVNSIIKL